MIRDITLKPYNFFHMVAKICWHCFFATTTNSKALLLCVRWKFGNLQAVFWNLQVNKIVWIEGDTICFLDHVSFHSDMPGTIMVLLDKFENFWNHIFELFSVAYINKSMFFLFFGNLPLILRQNLHFLYLILFLLRWVQKGGLRG